MIDLKDLDPGVEYILVLDENHDKALGGVRFRVGEASVHKHDGIAMHGHPSLISGPDVGQSFSSPQSIHWLTTVTPEALSEIRARNEEYCIKCNERDVLALKDDAVHGSVRDCTALRGSPCVTPTEHHAFVVGALPPSWDTDAIDRAVLLRALDEAMAAAEDR